MKNDNPWQLDEEEKQILKDYGDGNYVPVENEAEKIKEAVQAARNTIRKNKNINIRLSEGNIIKLKQKAAEVGLPYQTIISTLIYQYVEGKIKITL